MSKLYFLVPDAELAGQIVEDLKHCGIAEDDIGVLANHEALVTDLPDADVTDTSDVKSAFKRGAAFGGATGLLAGLAATIVPGGFAAGGAALAGMALAGSAFGAWASSLIGVSVPNQELERFQQAIEDGSLLMIVSTTAVDRETAKRIVSDRHPDVLHGGEGDTARDTA